VVYRIEGKLTNLEDSVVYIVFESEDSNTIDTVLCEKPGVFKTEQNLEGFNQATLFFENRTAWFTVYLEPGVKVALTGDMAYPTMLQAKGGRINNELTSLRKKQASLLKEQTDLSNRLNRSDGTNAIDGNDLFSQLTNVEHQLDEQIADYIQHHPQEEASVVLMQSYFLDPDDTRKLDEWLIALDPGLKDFYLVKELEQYSIRAKRTALGAEAPNFSVKNVCGEIMNLDSFANKYLLLTFTAPWCDMCQTEDLYLDKIGKKYSEDELKQLIVSLDYDMEGVRDLLKYDSIPWNLVTDSAGQATMLVDLYNVSALPRCFIIDENGTIILKTDNGAEVLQALGKIITKE
jgi:peroxiredoxin